MATLEIRLFGVLALERAGRAPARLPSRKVRDLLAYLLLHRRAPQSREHLAAQLWGECDGDKGRHCLNTALWRLRSVLQDLEGGDHPYLRIDALSIGFNPASDFRLDVAEFEAACQHAEQAGPQAPEAQAEWYRRAIDLYRGDLLTACYDDWCLVERERLQLRYLRALAALLAFHQRRREYDAAIDCARRTLACDPLREKVHRELIRMYLEVGDQAAALRQYELCEETVRRELGAEIMPETRAAIAGILQRLPAPPAHAARAASAGKPSEGSGTRTPLDQLAAALAIVERARGQLAEATALLEAVQRQLRQPPAEATVPTLMLAADAPASGRVMAVRTGGPAARDWAG